MARAAIPLVLAQLALLLTWDLASRPLALLVALGFGFAALPWAVAGVRRAGDGIFGPVLLVAAMLRLLALPLPPTLSDDVYRYVWDGRVIGAGMNPYLLAPEAEKLTALRNDLWQQLPHRAVETVYPPMALTLFSIAARLPAPVLALKALFAAFDLLTCWLLLHLALRLGVPPARTIWYAWNPLACLEFAGMGHVDAVGIAAMAAVVWLLLARPVRLWEAAVAAAAAILAKIVPVLALPLWARAAGRPWVFLAITGSLTLIAFLPVLVAAGGVPPGAVEFGVSWEFNGPLHEPLWRALDALGAPELVSRGLDRLKTASGWHELWNHFYPFNYPQFLSKAILAGVGLFALIAVWRRRRPVESTGPVFGVLVLFSATVYPWYVLWIVPWAALFRQPAWLLLSATLALSYWPQFTDAPLFPWVYLAVWGPFFLLLARSPRWRPNVTA